MAGTPSLTKPLTFRVVVFSDCHDNPDLPQARFRQIGLFAAEQASDYVICLGDWLDCEFASRFDTRDTISGRSLSSFKREMDSLRNALDLFQTPLAHLSKPPKLVTTLGNHEQRIFDFENKHPEVEGMMISDLYSALSEWKVYAYKDYFMLGGVGFTHVPHNVIGKPYGGKTADDRILSESTFSIVRGHDHRASFRTAQKIGPKNQLAVFNPGCALPDGHVKDYCRLLTTGWSYSVGTLEICGGRIIGHSVVSMSELARRYG